MRKSSYHIPKMDCPSEEQLIRLKLADLKQIQSLEFDIPNRQLTVFHTGDTETIFKKLEQLNFGASITQSVAVDSSIVFNHQNANQRTLLRQVLFINFGFFIIETVFGWYAESMGLLADGLDMLADSVVYGLALLAIGKAANKQKLVSQFAGWLQAILASVGILEVFHRFIENENNPNPQGMIIISALALIANAICLWLLQKSKSTEAHMRASVIFTSNDVIVNAGVILAGLLVLITGSNWPDLLIGIAVFSMVTRGSIQILQLNS